MKNLTTKSTQFNTIALSILTVFITLALSSCSRKINFNNSSVVPAARGYVKVTNDKNKNYAIKIQLSELAEVQRLEPAKKTYVVWMLTDQEVTKNIGQITSKSGMMSKQLKASFETVSSFKPIRVFITAEDDAEIQFPSSQLVLSTDNFYK